MTSILRLMTDLAMQPVEIVESESIGFVYPDPGYIVYQRGLFEKDVFPTLTKKLNFAESRDNRGFLNLLSLDLPELTNLIQSNKFLATSYNGVLYERGNGYINQIFQKIKDKKDLKLKYTFIIDPKQYRPLGLILGLNLNQSEFDRLLI